MAEDGKVIIGVDLDDKGFKSATERLGGVAGGALKAVGVGAAAASAAIVGVGTAAIKSYANYEQLVGGVDTLFKESSKTVQQYADNAYKTAGLSANQYMETVTSFSASLLQSLGGDTDKAAKAADTAITDMADNANKMGSSIETIQVAYQGFAKQNFTMLDNLKLGYGGTKEEMQRLLEDAQKLSGQEYDITNLNDVYEAIHVVQTELGITGTTAKEASSTIAGSAASMKAAWQNLLTGIADPTQNFDQLIQNLVSSVVTFGENLIPRIEATLPMIAEGITSLVTALVPYIAPALEKLLPGLVDGVIGLVNSIVESLPAILGALSATIPAMIQAILTMLPKLLDAAIEIIVSLADGLVKALPELIPALIDTVIAIVEGLIDNVDKLVDAAIAITIALAEGLIKALPKLIAKAPEIIIKLVSALIENAPKLVEAAFQLIGMLAQGFIDSLGAIVKVGENIVKGIWEGIKGGWKWLVDSVSNLAKSLLDGVKNALGIHSPSALFRDQIGVNIAKGIGVGFDKEFASVQRDITDSMKGLVTDAQATIGIDQANMASGTYRGISGVTERISSSTQTVVHKVELGLKGGLEQLAELIHDPLQQVDIIRGGSY